MWSESYFTQLERKLKDGSSLIEYVFGSPLNQGFPKYILFFPSIEASRATVPVIVATKSEFNISLTEFSLV